MSFLLDTDTCSAHLRDVRTISGRLSQYARRLYVSVISLGELYSWVLRSKTAANHRARLTELVSDLTILDVDAAVARQFGRLRAHLLDKGQPLPALDLLIGTTALTHELIVVTHNLRDFTRIPDVQAVDWLTP